MPRYQWADVNSLTILVVEARGSYRLVLRGSEDFDAILVSGVEIEPYRDSNEDGA